MLRPAGAGEAASFPDAAYADAGATIGSPWDAEAVVKVRKPDEPEVSRLRDGQPLDSCLQRARHCSETPLQLAQRHIRFALLFASPLADDIGFGSPIRLTAVFGSLSRAALVSADLAAVALAGIAVALLLPKSAPAPPTTSLSPTSTALAPQLPARR